MAKKIGVLTSGGDCAGLNSLLAFIVQCANQEGWEVIGIKNGTSGLIKRPIECIKLNISYINNYNLISRGGTILGAINKGRTLKETIIIDGRKQTAEELFCRGTQELGLDALIVIGGDGSIKILNSLAKSSGLPFIAIPKTIDNDVLGTDFTIGYKTALQRIVDYIDVLQSTIESHRRIMVLEIMGRDSGYLTLNSGIAGGADIILIPEIKYNLEIVANKIKSSLKESGKNNILIVCSEAINSPLDNTQVKVNNKYGGIAKVITNKLQNMLKLQGIRYERVGLFQRGGSPIFADRILALRFAANAIECIKNNKSGVVMTIQNDQIIHADISKIAKGYKKIDPSCNLIKEARIAGISFGD